MQQWPRERWWQLLEAGADDPATRQLLESLLVLGSDPDADVGPIEIGSERQWRLVEHHRVVPLLPLERVVSHEQDRVKRRQVEIAAAQLQLRYVATRALELLAAEGIEARVLKGLATGELDHVDHRRRHTGDVDLAVAPERIDDAIRVLVADGASVQPTRFDPELWYGRTLDTPTGFEIDLHTRLFRRSPLGASLVDDAGVPLAELPGLALPAEERLVHAAGHFIISPPGTRRMNGMLDIGRIVTRPDLDLERARAVAARLGVERLVGAGISVEAYLSGRGDVLRTLQSWAQPDWLERRTRLVAHRRLVLDHLARHREVPPGRRLAYLPAWILPTAAQRRLLGESVRSAVGRAAQRARPTPLVSASRGVPE